MLEESQSILPVATSLNRLFRSNGVLRKRGDTWSRDIPAEVTSGKVTMGNVESFDTDVISDESLPNDLDSVVLSVYSDADLVVDTMNTELNHA